MVTAENRRVSMITPKTKGGQELKAKFDVKIKEVLDAAGPYPRSGPKSKHIIINVLKAEYNQLLQKIEEVSSEELLESTRPQMAEPKTESGKQLKGSYDSKIQTIEKGAGAYPKSGKGSRIELVNDLRIEFNILLGKIEDN